jgi:D-glycero-alpha-D-manno-heptose-7-phosphate kinase
VFAHAQAPVRIGIAGGGTDLPIWTRESRGLCLSLAVKMYTHAVAIERPDGQVVASYRRLDTATSATEIANGLIRESALMHGWEHGFEVHTLSELSSRGTGLGVSSSIAVSLAACFQCLRDLREPRTLVPTPAEIARDAWCVEIDRLRRPIGRQDHMAAAYGGLRLYAFEGDTASIAQTLDAESALWLARHLCIVRLPRGHNAHVILRDARLAALAASLDLVQDALSAIDRRSLHDLGDVLTRGHLAKKSGAGSAVPSWLDEITNRIVQVCGSHVAGFKVAGAGGGGHLVVACEPGAHSLIAAATSLPVSAVEPDFTGVRSDGWT